MGDGVVPRSHQEKGCLGLRPGVCHSDSQRGHTPSPSFPWAQVLLRHALLCGHRACSSYLDRLDGPLSTDQKFG